MVNKLSLNLSVTKVLKEYRYPVIKGQVCRVVEYSLKFLKPIGQNSDEDSLCYLFVKGFLDLGWTHADLHEAFKKYGEIESAKVSLDKDHNSKGYGYIKFQTPEQAEKAIQEVRLIIFLRFKDEWELDR